MEFSKQYQAELTQFPASEAVSKLQKLSQTHSLILLTATRDIQHSSAKVLADVIEKGDSQEGLNS